MRFIALPLLVFLCSCMDVEPVETGEVLVDRDGDGSPEGEDCDDEDAAALPGAEEICDGIDNDCDGLTDEDVTTLFFADADGAGYGDAAAPIEACERPEDAAATGDDCDDDAATTYPGAAELCDGADNDCDGAIDEGVTTTFFVDADGDGHGDPARPVEACEQPEDASVLDDDCDDSDPEVFPEADGTCPDGRGCSELLAAGVSADGIFVVDPDLSLIHISEPTRPY